MKLWKTALGIFAGAAATGYAAAVAYLYLRQEKLVFIKTEKHPLQRLFLERYGNLTSKYIIEGNFSEPTLRGWYVQGKNPNNTLILYFGGNAENIDTAMFLSDNIPNADMLALHYRGYGLSDGKPSEEALFTDALRIIDHVQKVHPDKKIVLFGRSLGSGIALYAAANRPEIVQQVILTTPYDSLAAVAKRHYSWVPIHTLLKHQFNTSYFASKVRTPVHIIVAGKDTYIPSTHATKLYQSLINTSVRWDIVEDADHTDIHDWNKTWKLINSTVDTYQGLQLPDAYSKSPALDKDDPNC